jgi:NAD(P)-dependent dehydrogenase (short-subunit alcohol dehydrogenase family)
MGYVLSKRVMNLYAATIVPLFGEKKIRVNCVLPGQTQTGLTGDFVAMRGGMDKAVESTGFVKRLADAREMAEPLVFLNSGMASYISGVMLDGDFGIHAMVKTGVIPDRMNFKLLSK